MRRGNDAALVLDLALTVIVRNLFVSSCLAALTFAITPPARADVPSPSNSTTPHCISVLGYDASGVLDPIGEFTVIERDLANQPIRNGLIVVDFSDCPELRFCADQHQPGVIVHCPTRTVRRFTDANGRATFRVAGWFVPTPPPPDTPYNSAKIFADGVLFGRPSIQIYDLDGNGLGAADLSLWLADLFSGNNPPRGDYDCSGSLGASDLSQWLTVYFANGSPANCSPAEVCP